MRFEYNHAMNSKRKIKQNIYGNWNGYVGRNRIQEFGTDSISAAYWFLTGEVNFLNGYSDDNFSICKEILNKL